MKYSRQNDRIRAIALLTSRQTKKREVATMELQYPVLGVDRRPGSNGWTIRDLDSLLDTLQKNRDLDPDCRLPTEIVNRVHVEPLWLAIENPADTEMLDNACKVLHWLEKMLDLSVATCEKRGRAQPSPSVLFASRVSYVRIRLKRELVIIDGERKKKLARV